MSPKPAHDVIGVYHYGDERDKTERERSIAEEFVRLLNVRFRAKYSLATCADAFPQGEPKFDLGDAVIRSHNGQLHFVELTQYCPIGDRGDKFDADFQFCQSLKRSLQRKTWRTGFFVDVEYRLKLRPESKRHMNDAAAVVWNVPPVPLHAKISDDIADELHRKFGEKSVIDGSLALVPSHAQVIHHPGSSSNLRVASEWSDYIETLLLSPATEPAFQVGSCLCGGSINLNVGALSSCVKKKLQVGVRRKGDFVRSGLAQASMWLVVYATGWSTSRIHRIEHLRALKIIDVALHASSPWQRVYLLNLQCGERFAPFIRRVR